MRFLASGKRYAVLALGESLVMENQGPINLDDPSLKSVRDIRMNLPYFETCEALSNSKIKGSYNMTKAGIMVVGENQGKVHLGYSLFLSDGSRVDYASVLYSRRIWHGRNPLGIYSKRGLSYHKIGNDAINPLGAMALVIAGLSQNQPIDEGYALVVKRGSGVEFRKGTWTFPGGYVEPEQNLSLTADDIRNSVIAEIYEECAISPDELLCVSPVGVIQDENNPVVLYIAVASIPYQAILSRPLNSEIDSRAAVSVANLSSLLGSFELDSHAEGAIAVFASQKKSLEELVSGLTHR